MTIDYRQTSSGLFVHGVDVQVSERIAELENAQEDADWILLGASNNTTEFSRLWLTTITRTARLYYIKNPLIRRGVDVKAGYVWGRGINIQARDQDINDVVQTFLDDDHNQTELTAQLARLQKETELQIDGNIYFVLVPHKDTGHIRVYTIPVDEVTDIITDPTNRKASWYFKRVYTEITTDLATGVKTEAARTLYYQDWRNKPETLRVTIGGQPVVANQYIYHVKTGGFSDWLFGLSEIYPALDWAKAYRIFLENWSTIVAAYAVFAFQITTTGGKEGVKAAKAKIASTISTTSGERNPKPVTASNVIAQEGNNIAPIRTAGATTSAEDGRRLLLMVAASFGLPETFFSDVSVGTLATATSLDRPTELMMTNRQTMWADIYHDILDFVVFWATQAMTGPLRSVLKIEANEYGENNIVYPDDVDNHIDIDFPPILEHSMTDTMTSIAQGAAFINDPKLLTRMVLTALGQNDIDEILDRMYPDDGTMPTTPPETDPTEVDASTQALLDATATMQSVAESLHILAKDQSTRILAS